MVDFNVQQINNRALKTSDRLTFFQLFKWVAVGSVIVSLTLGYAWINHEILTINYQIEDLLSENSQLREDNRMLSGEEGLLTDPTRVEAAGLDLGLVPANQDEVVILDAETGPETRGMVADARLAATRE